LPLSKKEQEVCLLQDGEFPMARYEGSVAEDLLVQEFPYGCPGCCTKYRSYHPGVCLTCTCGVSPMISNNSMIVTNASIFTFNRKGNSPWCLPLRVLCGKEEWELLWIPVSSLLGSQVYTEFIGDDRCTTRCWKGTFFGNNCCPLIKSFGNVKITAAHNPHSDSVLMPMVTQVDMFKSLRVSPELKQFRQAIAMVESRLQAPGTNATATFKGQPVTIATPI